MSFQNAILFDKRHSIDDNRGCIKDRLENKGSVGGHASVTTNRSDLFLQNHPENTMLRRNHLLYYIFKAFFFLFFDKYIWFGGGSFRFWFCKSTGVRGGCLSGENCLTVSDVHAMFYLHPNLDNSDIVIVIYLLFLLFN